MDIDKQITCFEKEYWNDIMWYIELLLTKNGESNPILYCKKINDMKDLYDWDRKVDQRDGPLCQ